MKRRQFIKNTAKAGAASVVLPTFSIGRPGPSANSRLNIAMIGAGNIAGMAYGGCKGENIVALADVDANMFGQHLKKNPEIEKARKFEDFREMLDKMEKEIDAVCINTPDHTHFAATMHAMEMNKHVCTQKPLTYSVWEAQTLQKAKAKYGVMTNVAIQGHTFDGIRQMKEWYEADVFGQIHEIHSWRDGPEYETSYPGKWGYWHKMSTFPPPVDPIPSNLNWDLWLGPRAADIPFNKFYHPKSWRAYNQFGNGIFGDWMPHISDGPVYILDLYEPVTVELEAKMGGNEWICPDANRVKWTFKKRGSKAPCTFYWHNGPANEYRPEKPEEWTWSDDLPAGGTLYFGEKTVGYTDMRSNNPKLANKDEMKAFEKAGLPDEKYTRIKGGPFAEWVRAIKGDGPEPSGNFDFASPFTVMMLLGVLVTKVGGKIEWDPKKGITNRPELNKYLDPTPREGWDYGRSL